MYGTMYTTRANKYLDNKPFPSSTFQLLLSAHRSDMDSRYRQQKLGTQEDPPKHKGSGSQDPALPYILVLD